MNTFGWTDVVQNFEEKSQKRHDIFQKTLGEPILFIENDTDYPIDCGTGFFKGKNTVFTVIKYNNGYDPNSITYYSFDFIDKLIKVREV